MNWNWGPLQKILQNCTPVLQNCQRHVQGVRNGHRLGNAKERWPLHVLCYPGLNPGAKKNPHGKTGEIWTKPGSLGYNSVPTLVS